MRTRRSGSSCLTDKMSPRFARTFALLPFWTRERDGAIVPTTTDNGATTDEMLRGEEAVLRDYLGHFRRTSPTR
jgi:hypothetical protein